MLGAVLTGLVITLASLACGQAVMLAAGRARFSAVAPAAGLSALLVVCGIAVKLPGHAVTAAIAAGLAVGAAIWFLAREREGLGPVPLGAVVAVGGAALVIAIPFAVNGRVGVLGQGLVNDDMASHLLFTEWLDTRVGATPDLVQDGYPLGPHAIVAAAGRVTGAGYVEAFAGLTGAIAVLTALTAYGALAGARPLLRIPASVLVSLPYLAAAYHAQGAFKEPMLALAVLGFALSLPALRGGDRLAALPAGVIAAGTVYNYSFPGLAWLIGTAVAWLAIFSFRERAGRGGLDLGGRLRRARSQLVVIAGLPVLAAIPELFRLASFTDFKAFNPGEGEDVGLGNLRQALNPLESLGVWPSSEFRITAERAGVPEPLFYLGGLLALGVLGWGLWRAVRRREAVLPAALAAGVLGYLGALAVGTPYTQAKALAIAAPVIMLIGLRGLLRAGPVEGEERETPIAAGEGEARLWARPLVRLGVPLVGAAFVIAAAFSSLLPLRQAAVGPDTHANQLISMRPLVTDQDVLFLGRESFIAWELLGARVHAPVVHNYNVDEVPSLYRATSTRAKFDFDTVPTAEFKGEFASDPDSPDVLEDFDWVITTNTAQQSEAPPSFEPAKRTRDYVLWRRVGPDEPRRTLVEPSGPGTTVDCANPVEGAVTELPGTARVFRTTPVTGRAWKPDPDITDAQPGSEELLLAPGSWQISLQYAATESIHVRTPDLPEPAGLDVTLPPNLIFRGATPYYPVGRIETGARGVVRFEVTMDRPPLAARVLGTDPRGYLGPIAATPTPAETTVPLADACGRYLDWYRADPSASPEALARVERPTPREVIEN